MPLQPSPHNPIQCLKEDGLKVTYLKDGQEVTTYIPELFNLCPDCPWWWWHFDSTEECRAYMVKDMSRLGFKIVKCARQLTFMDELPKRQYLGIGAAQ
jgi:hypothetical protein